MSKSDPENNKNEEKLALKKLEKEYEYMSSPKEWLESQNTGKEQLYLIGLYIIWLAILVIILNLIANQLLGTYFWLYSILPLIAVCIALYSRVRKLEFQIYELDWQFHLRKRLRELGIRQWVMTGLGIDSIVRRRPLYKTKIIDFKIPFFSRKKDLGDSHK